MNDDTNESFNTSISLKQDKNMLSEFAFQCVKQCIARNQTNLNFYFLALIYNDNNFI